MYMEEKHQFILFPGIVCGAFVLDPTFINLFTATCLVQFRLKQIY
jgi:hypothetical protein